MNVPGFWFRKDSMRLIRSARYTLAYFCCCYLQRAARPIIGSLIRKHAELSIRLALIELTVARCDFTMRRAARASPYSHRRSPRHLKTGSTLVSEVSSSTLQLPSLLLSQPLRLMSGPD
jgi:hypothetical protein